MAVTVVALTAQPHNKVGTQSSAAFALYMLSQQRRIVLRIALHQHADIEGGGKNKKHIPLSCICRI